MRGRRIKNIREDKTWRHTTLYVIQLCTNIYGNWIHSIELYSCRLQAKWLAYPHQIGEMKKEDKKMKQMQGKQCRPVPSYSFNVVPCSLSLKGVGDQLAWVDFNGKEEIGVEVFLPSSKNISSSFLGCLYALFWCRLILWSYLLCLCSYLHIKLPFKFTLKLTFKVNYKLFLFKLPFYKEWIVPTIVESVHLG